MPEPVARTLPLGPTWRSGRYIGQEEQQVRKKAALDEKYGPDKIIVRNVVLNNIDFEDSYNEAIAKKSQAIQDQQRQDTIEQWNGELPKYVGGEDATFGILDSAVASPAG